MSTKNIRGASIALHIAACCYVCGFGHLVRASNNDNGPAGKLHETKVATSSMPLIAQCNYKLWVPEETPVIRTVFIINMRAAGKHLFYKDTEWREMASRNSAAMMYCEFEAYGVRDNGYGLSMLRACDQFAAKLNRPELKHAPFILWGHSMGGRVAQDFVRFMPSRVLAFHIGLRAHPSPKDFMEEKADAMCVPGLYLMGAADRKPKDMREHFARARKANSPRGWIWLPRQSHWPKGMDFTKDTTTDADWRAWAANDVVIPWTEAMIRLRMPKDSDPCKGPVKLTEVDITKGWLGNIKTGRIATYDNFFASKSEASWFPSESVANAWVRFSSATTE